MNELLNCARAQWRLRQGLCGGISLHNCVILFGHVQLSRFRKNKGKWWNSSRCSMKNIGTQGMCLWEKSWNNHIEDPAYVRKDKRSGHSGGIKDGGIKRSRITIGRAEETWKDRRSGSGRSGLKISDMQQFWGVAKSRVWILEWLAAVEEKWSSFLFLKNT